MAETTIDPPVLTTEFTPSPLTEIDITFVKALREAIKKRGEDFVYPDQWRTQWPVNVASYEGEEAYGACQYHINGKGGCIVGYAIQLATGTPYLGENGQADSILIEQYGVSRAVADSFLAAQRAQDEKQTWGEALKVFETKMAYYGYALPEDDS